MKESTLFLLILFPLFLLTLLPLNSFGQCYTPRLNGGIKEYNAKNYDAAIDVFNAAKKCADKPSDGDKVLNEWIQKCLDAQKPVPETKPEAKSEPPKKEESKPLTPNQTGTVTGISGKVYPTVKIGDQWWMAENLNETKYDTESNKAGAIIYTSEKEVYTPYYTKSRMKNAGLLYNWAAAVEVRDGQAQKMNF